MKKILGLDLGTNSIGWALVEIDHENGTVKIQGLGSRILPMDAGEINDFESNGKIKSSASQRTDDRGVRRNKERYLLRRDRLHVVLNLLNALPVHYKIQIDFERNGKRCGQFKDYKEPNLVYVQNKINNKKYDFLFEDTYVEMLNELGVEYKKQKLIPRDWTLYYLRQKALTKRISLEELAWVLLSYNQKRGYEKIEVEDKATKENELVEELDLPVKMVTESFDKKGRKYFKVELESNDNLTYNEYSEKQMTFEGDLKEVVISSQIDEETHKEIDKEFSVVDIYTLEIENVDYEKDGGKHCFTLTYDNGWVEAKTPIKNYTSKYSNAINKEYEYIVKTVYDDNGNIKLQKGKERSFKEPDFSEKSNDWTLLKKKTEKEALAFNYDKEYLNEKNEPLKYISPKIYDILKNDAQNGTRTKIIGGMFQVVEREFYREELAQIISTQKKYHTNLDDKKIFEDCVRLLYPNNESHAKTLLSNKNAIQHLLVEDILLYQRPLKTKKSEIANCKHEIRYWKDAVHKETGEVIEKQEPVFYKVASASHPYFQEFRIWDKLHNLRLIQIEKEVDGKTKTNVDVTNEYFTEDIYHDLFVLLNNKKSFTQSALLNFFETKFKEKNESSKNFVWNFPEDEEIKGNETRVSFAIRFKRCGFDYTDFLTQEKEIALWHYLYSVSYKERIANDYKSIKSFFSKFLEGVDVSEEIECKLVNDYANYPKFASKYCAYSEKALKKLLPLIRMGTNRFEGKFDISEFRAELESISYDKSKITSLVKSNSIGVADSKEEFAIELKKQRLYEAVWKHSINKRIQEIIKRLNTIDFSAKEIDFTKVVCNDSCNGNLPFPKGLFNVFNTFKEQDDFTNLNLTQASYLVYGRHSELAQVKYWSSPEQIRKELHSELKQHSLNNPVAEKVILEMMQIVADIWEYYGAKNPDETYQKLFNEIHLEVGRELKKSAKEKEKISKNQNENKVQNKRLRQTLEEFLSQSPYNAIPQNSDHFERLKIVEGGASHTKNTDKKFFDDKTYTKKEIEDILKKPYISKDDFDKYKLWVEQGYRSPYTDRIIKLTDLFNGNKYNVDHVFPQASVTNDSLSNKVVCETEINKHKSNQTGREFINNPKFRSIPCLAYKTNSNPEGYVDIIDDENYVRIVKAQFSGNKRQILLSKEIPSNFTNSQLNNSRHIARKAMELLSHIVREEGEVEFRSKNVLPVTGEITSRLKRSWKLDEVWRELVAPRFMRMNELTKSNLFGQEQISKSGEKYFDCNIDDTIREKNPSYDIKRIDHRHHALDALIVALCTEEHVNYINNINAKATSDNYGKQKQIEKYRTTLKRKIMFSKPNKENPSDKDWYYMLPGQIRKEGVGTFGIDTVLQKSYSYRDDYFNSDYKKMVLSALQNTIVTFKQNLRVINNTVNKYKKGANSLVIQNTENGRQKNWTIRRSLGKGTMYGKLDIGERINKQLLKNSDFFYNNIDAIADKDFRVQIGRIKSESSSFETFEMKLKEKFKNIMVKCIAFKAVSRFNSDLDISFNREKIKTIVDKGIQRILSNRLNEFDTIELPFEIALKYYDSVLEKQELEFIINNEESSFDDIYEFLEFLKGNDYKYKKDDYTNLNVFIEQISNKDYRNDDDFKDKIIEHPEIAFTSERIEEMNKTEVLIKLNKGKLHKPIRKMKTYTSFGKEKRVSNNELSKKYNQYVKVDKGTNFYIAMYEIVDQSKISKKCPVRIFKEISLFDLIEYQKSTNSFDLPIEKRVYQESEEYKFLFTLTQNDIIKVDIDGEELVYAFNRFSEGDIYFRPVTHATEIEKYEVDRKINEKTGKLGGSQVNETTSIYGKQIKNICWKLQADRLGNIISVINHLGQIVKVGE